MNTQQPRTNQYGDPNCRECEDKDNLTQKTITAERQKICTTLYDTAGTVGEMEEKFEGERHIYYERKCMFTWTETNYRLYRNLDITVGTELVQTNELQRRDIPWHAEPPTRLSYQRINVNWKCNSGLLS